MSIDSEPGVVFFNNSMNEFPVVQFMSTFQPISAKAPKAAFAQGAWGFILTLPSQTLYEDYYKYELALYIDGVYIDAAPGQQDTEGTNLRLTVIYSSAPKESLRFVVREVGKYICEGDLEIGLMNLTSTLLPCSDSLVEGMQVRFHLELDAKMLVTSPGTGSYVSEVVTLKNTASAVTMPRVITVTSTATGAQVGYIYVQYINYSWYCIATSSSINGLGLAYNKVILKSIEVVSEPSPNAGYIYFNFNDVPAYGDIGFGNWNEVRDGLWAAGSSYTYPILTVTTTDYNVRFEEPIISDDEMVLMYKVNPIEGEDISGLYIESICYLDETSPNLSELCYMDPVGGTDLGETIASRGIAGSIDSGGNKLTFAR